MMRGIWTPTAALCLTAAVSRSQGVVTNGLVAYYPFSGNFNDASGNSNNGTAINGATFGTDYWGNANSAGAFDGINDYVNVAPAASLVAKRKFSLAFRFKTNSATHQIPISKADYLPAGSSLNNVQYHVGFYGNSQSYANAALFLGTTHNGNSCISNTLQPTNTNHRAFGTIPIVNQWHCVVMTFDSGAKKVFIDGVLAGQSSTTGFINNDAPDSCAAGALRLGVWWGGDPRWFSGLLDEVRVYNRALNILEIDSLCNFNPNLTTINHYGAVLAFDSCTNALTLDDAQAFNTGDTVLMIQMKGATVDSSNTAAFGDILQTGNAGNYEFNVIQSKTGNIVRLQNVIQRTYSIPHGKVQLVRVPHYPSYTAGVPHTAPAWNGAKGGVFAISVANQLTLNASVDVMGKGFRGGVQIPVPPSVQNCGITTWSGPLAINLTAEKGEGIAEVSASKMGGRGKLANGGGAGNAHNAGGGGSNAGAGGQGGSEFVGCSPNPNTSVAQGVGGIATSYSNPLNKIFMGGGGGAGEVNNYTQASGGAGGGIIIIRAGTVSSSNNGQLIAGGQAAPECTVAGPNNICTDGMGGGGGGGAFWITGAVVPGSVTVQNDGGANGTILYNSSAWGAQSGSSGQTLTNLSMPVANVPFVQPSGVMINDSILSCRTVLFTATGGTGTPTWTFGNGATTTGNPVTYTYPAGGTFLATVQYPGCNGSDTETVVLPNNPIINAGPNVSVCAGNSVTITASGGSSYVWTPAAGLSNTTGSTVIAFPTATTNYIVTGTAVNGCTGTGTVQVTVNPVPTVTATASPAVICSFASSTLTAASTLGGSISWTPIGLTGANVAVGPGFTTVYTATATTGAGCTGTDTALVTVLPKPVVLITTPDATVCPQSPAILTASVSGSGTFAWQSPIPGPGNTATVTSAPVTAPTNFTVYFTAANGCEDTATQLIGVHTAPVVSIAGPALLCSGTGPAALTASGASSFVWTPSQFLNATTGNTVQALPPVGTSMTYTATGTDANGCTGTAQQNLSVAPTPTVNAGMDTAICSGSSVVLTASGAASILWNPTNATSNSITVTETVNANTTYTYIATGTTGACSDADTVKLTVRGLPSVSTLPKSVNICRYDSARLAVTGAAIYAWSPVGGLANPAGAITMAKPDSLMVYIVTGTDIYGCVNRDTVRVMVNDALPVKASGDGQPISCDNSLAQLHAAGATTYVWSPGQYLNDSTMAHPVATPPATMLFTVIGSNSAGCTGRDTITVLSVRESALMMPNAFTPNGDGINDRVHPLVYCDFTFRSFSVYNRWGQRVFLGTKQEQGWDGRFNGEPCDVGVYIFTVEGESDRGATKMLTGNVTLLK